MKSILLTLTLLGLILASCTLDSNLFNPEEVDAYQLPGNTIPANLIEEVELDSDGNKIYGFWVSSSGERPGLTILYCHGNKHNIDEYWDRVMLLHELGVNIFIFDYRGYGKSEGESSEAGLYADSEAALEYVKGRPEYNSDSLCFYGYSLGNVASIYLAAEIQDPLCLFSEAPFASANSLTQGSLILDIQPRWLTDGEFDNAENVKKINTPFMLFHGEDDDFVRYRDNGKVVYDASPNPKELVLVADAVHDNVPYIMGKENYLNKIRDWIRFSIGQ
ncbi:MAG: alpha/beta hydrolase [Melioribacteraceae bacterium]|nr:alpha/beta hydrolase [Melioribacteraceae bacterium]